MYLQDNPRWNNRLQCYVNRQNVPIIYVDGSCKHNGKPYAKSGIGIWISENEGYSFGNPYQDTNQFAELGGIYEALLFAQEQGWRRVEIRTDSGFAIKAVRQYAPNWRINADEYGNWYNSKGGRVKHQELIEKIEELEDMFDSVRLVKVPAHQNEIGNEGADRLARSYIDSLRY